MPIHPVGALLLSLALMTGCGKSAEVVEAEKTYTAIARMRLASPEERVPLLKALEGETCRSALGRVTIFVQIRGHRAHTGQ